MGFPWEKRGSFFGFLAGAQRQKCRVVAGCQWSGRWSAVRTLPGFEVEGLDAAGAARGESNDRPAREFFQVFFLGNIHAYLANG